MNDHPQRTVPLTVAADSDVATVARVKGTPEIKSHLANLGFVEGTPITIVSHVNGDVIVLVKGSRLGLNRDMASKIYVCA